VKPLVGLGEAQEKKTYSGKKKSTLPGRADIEIAQFPCMER